MTMPTNDSSALLCEKTLYYCHITNFSSHITVIFVLALSPDTDIFRVDSKSVCMPMLSKAGAKIITKFCEFVVNRCGLGRGGEHAFLRWNMGAWDSSTTQLISNGLC